MASPDPSDRIGPYLIKHQLARGGMATIFLARQLTLDRDVALKRLDLRGDEPNLAERFLQEARTVASLHHANIVTVHDLFEHDGLPYFAMEYLERGSLRPHIGRLRPTQIFGVLEGILAGLAHAEEHGIAHRDLKPENVLVTRTGGVKIVDFGILRAYNTVTTRLTKLGMTAGTPDYMAPEQARGQAVGPQTDLYALGVMTYEMLSSRLPFGAADTPEAIMYRHTHEPPPPLGPGLRRAEPRLVDWVMWMLAKEPRDRPAGARQAWEALEEIAVDRHGSYWRRAAAIGASAKPSPSDVVPQESAEAPPSDTGPESEWSSWVDFEPAPPAHGEGESSDLLPEESPAASDLAHPLADDRAPPDEAADHVPHVDREGESEDVERDDEAADDAGETSPAPPPADEVMAKTRPPLRPIEEQPVGETATRAPLSRRAVAAIGAVGVLALAALAYAIAPSATRGVPPTLETHVDRGALGFRTPGDWERLTASDETAPGGLELEQPLAVRPPDAGPGETVSAGFSSTTAPSLLPATFERSLEDRPVEPQPVRLGETTALRYAGLRQKGSNTEATVYAIPTSAGVVTLACRGARSGPVAKACDAIAGSLEITGPDVYSPPPRRAFARTLNRTIATVGRAEARQGARLRRARSASKIAAALEELSDAYGTAAGAVRNIDVAPAEAGPTKSLARSLDQLERSHKAISEAAAGEQRGAYRRLKRRLAADRAEFVNRLESLSVLGYRTTRSEST